MVGKIELHMSDWQPMDALPDSVKRLGTEILGRDKHEHIKMLSWEAEGWCEDTDKFWGWTATSFTPVEWQFAY